MTWPLDLYCLALLTASAWPTKKSTRRRVESEQRVGTNNGPGRDMPMGIILPFSPAAERIKQRDAERARRRVENTQRPMLTLVPDLDDVDPLDYAPMVLPKRTPDGAA